MNECRPRIKPVWSTEITLRIVFSRRNAKAVAKMFTSLFKRDTGWYEPHSVLILSGFSKRIIAVSFRVSGSDPRRESHETCQAKLQVLLLQIS